jgi:hypothetical protein
LNIYKPFIYLLLQITYWCNNINKEDPIISFVEPNILNIANNWTIYTYGPEPITLVIKPVITDIIYHIYYNIFYIFHLLSQSKHVKNCVIGSSADLVCIS